MGTVKKNGFTPSMKAKVAIEAVKEIETTGQIASRYQVHPIQVGLWKKQLLEQSEHLFRDPQKREKDTNQDTLEHLYREIGKQKIEIDWLKKKVGLFE